MKVAPTLRRLRCLSFYGQEIVSVPLPQQWSNKSNLAHTGLGSSHIYVLRQVDNQREIIDRVPIDDASGVVHE